MSLWKRQLLCFLPPGTEFIPPEPKVNIEKFTRLAMLDVVLAGPDKKWHFSPTWLLYKFKKFVPTISIPAHLLFVWKVWLRWMRSYQRLGSVRLKI